MHQAKAGKGNYFFKSGALFHREKIADHWVEQLVLPQKRRKQVMHFAHRTLTSVPELELNYILSGLVFAKMFVTLCSSVKIVIFAGVTEEVIMYQLLRL